MVPAANQVLVGVAIGRSGASGSIPLAQVTTTAGGTLDLAAEIAAAVEAARAELLGPLTLADIKEFLRLIGNAHDNLLESLMLAAKAYVAEECDLLTTEPEEWPALPKLAAKMLIAGWFTNPEAYTTQEVQESPAVQRIIRLYKSWVPQ